MDLRKLNAVTLNDLFPLPFSETIVEDVVGSQDQLQIHTFVSEMKIRSFVIEIMS